VFEATKKINWMNATGDLSYPVYLVHMIVLLAIGPWLINVAWPLDLKAEADWRRAKKLKRPRSRSLMQGRHSGAGGGPVQIWG
jgi:hypothetical protein